MKNGFYLRTLINIFIFVLIFSISIFADVFISLHWSEQFIIDRSFPVLFRFISIMDILDWVPRFGLFFIMSIVLYLMVKSDHPLYWSIVLGFSATIVFFLKTRVHFSEHVSTISYLYYYASYFIAPIASFLGGVIGSKLRKYLLNRTNR